MEQLLYSKNLFSAAFFCHFFFFASTNAKAQDLIITKNNQGIKAKILEIAAEKIRYKYFEDPEGDPRSMKIEDVLVVVYENGQWQSFYYPDLSKKTVQEEKRDSDLKKKGKYGRRAIRQLGYMALYRESMSDYPNANRYGINYSVGHIKDDRSFGFLFELGINVFKEGLYDGEEKVLDNYNPMMSVLFGMMIKFYKTNKLLIYGKAAGGGVVVASFVKEPEDSFEYNTFSGDYNYNLALGLNYKLAGKFGLFAEGGYSRVQMLQAGISFMID